MELNSMNETLVLYGADKETTVELPVQTEILIPDYLPAVFKILKCIIDPVVMQSEIEANHWKGTGYLRCTVYYQADDTTAKICRTEQKYSFEKSAELPLAEYMARSPVFSGELVYCNCRAVSEHRIEVQGAFALHVKVSPAEKSDVLKGLSGCGMEQNVQLIDADDLISYEDTIITSKGKIEMPGVGESVLDIGGYYQAKENNLEKDRLICTGELRIRVCYAVQEPKKDGREDFRTKEISIPVEQLLHPESEQDDRVVAWGQVLGCTLQADENGTEADEITVTWRLHTECWRAHRIETVTDAYSTICNTELIQREIVLKKIAEPLNRAITVSAEEEMDDITQDECFCLANVPKVELKEEKGIHLTANGTIYLFYTDASGELGCQEKTYCVEIPTDHTGQSGLYGVHASVHMDGIICRHGNKGIHIEAELKINGLLLQTEKYIVVQEIKLGEVLPQSGEGPAAYLYFAKKGEKLFDIAKHYHAKVNLLTKANDMCAEDASAAQICIEKDACLLIPSAL